MYLPKSLGKKPVNDIAEGFLAATRLNKAIDIPATSLWKEKRAPDNHYIFSDIGLLWIIVYSY